MSLRRPLGPQKRLETVVSLAVVCVLCKIGKCRFMQVGRDLVGSGFRRLLLTVGQEVSGSSPYLFPYPLPHTLKSLSYSGALLVPKCLVAFFSVCLSVYV